MSAIPTANTTGGVLPYGRAIYNSVNYLLGKDIKLMTQLIQDIESLNSLVDLVKKPETNMKFLMVERRSIANG